MQEESEVLAESLPNFEHLHSYSYAFTAFCIDMYTTLATIRVFVTDG